MFVEQLCTAFFICQQHIVFRLIFAVVKRRQHVVSPRVPKIALLVILQLFIQR